MKEWTDNVVNRLKCWWDNRETRCGETHANCRDCPFHVPGYSMQDAVKDAIGWLYRLEAAQPKWISVEDELPKKWCENDAEKTLINYQIYSPKYGVDIGNYLKPVGMWVIMGFPVDDVTHWMPLPAGPKEEA